MDGKTGIALIVIAVTLLAPSTWAACCYPAAINQTYQRTIGLDANNARAWMGLGMAYLHGGQRELLKAAYAEAVRVDPSSKTQLARLMEQPAD